MKRSDILVGEDYAVVAHRTKGAKPVRGVVLAVGVERRVSSGYYGQTKTDGIRVRFDEPMTSAYSGFQPVTERTLGSQMTETVVAPNCLLWPWAEQVEYDVVAAAQRLANQQEADELGDAYEPILAQADAALVEVLGKEPEWSMVERVGTERKRTIQASIRVGPRTILALASLGVVAATDVPDSPNA